ncbi:MAG: hypothetical protein EPO21_12810 [Chloroflexota bacterium]|nr:MAG: hypothetical protein EPO21_12810 [Chloroflexota bacterium]
MDIDADLALLRRFEPVMRCTRGERFFPIRVEPYVQRCSLWAWRPRGEQVCLVPQGELTLAELSQSRPDAFGTVHYLKLTDPLSPGELAGYVLKRRLLQKNSQNAFRAGRGRLARVGYLSRLVAAAFAISLLARGRVPGDMAAAANIAYDRLMAQSEQCSYYGRVVRQNGWIVLQYWFFYLFDDWRSGFFGANDHEADWEMISLFLYETQSGSIVPEWAAFAAHDQSGDDLRRRWDDPELEKIGEHPIVYVGAGSHASYFQPGEYMTEIQLPFLAPYARVADALQGFWRDKLGQYVGEESRGEQTQASKILRVPFVVDLSGPA